MEADLVNFFKLGMSISKYPYRDKHDVVYDYSFSKIQGKCARVDSTIYYKNIKEILNVEACKTSEEVINNAKKALELYKVICDKHGYFPDLGLDEELFMLTKLNSRL